MDQTSDKKNTISAHPGRLYKRDFLWQTPVYMNRVTVETPYPLETAPAHLHIHEFVEISMVVAGKGIHQTMLQTTECSVGDVFIINEDTPHVYFALPDGERPTVCNVIFDPKDLFEGAYGNPENSKYCYNVFQTNNLFAYVKLDETVMEAVNRVLASFEYELSCQLEEWEQAVKAHLINLLIIINRCIPRSGVIPTQISLKDHQVAQFIMRMVLDHYGDCNLTLQDIAKKICVHKVQAGNVFSEVFGINFSEYLKQVRLEKACQMLAETDMTNEQIVAACGLRDVPNFYRQFKRQTGMTPLAFRKSKRSIEKTKKRKDRIT
jgi:AraC family L-rhamnose operon transcriptional activator RhaR